MLRLTQFAVLATVLAQAFGLLFPHGTKWNNLKVTWGANPFSSNSYVAMPLTEAEAKAQGFQKISDCGDSSGLLGRRYVKDNDMAVILIYDVHGHIAGISAAIQASSTYPTTFLKSHPFVLHNNMHHISAYFVDPAIICTSGRTNGQYTQQGVGTDLYLQNGTNPLTDSIKIPHKESGIPATHWTRGRCFPSMGVHYWFNSRKDMSCDEFYPVFLLYNGGQLDAFGWAFQTALTSPRVEHPPKSTISAFMNPVPDCLYSAGDLSTLHIYLSNNPVLDTC